MKSDEQAFNQLQPEIQKTAIDVTVAVSLLITRLPSLPEPLSEAIVKEFASQYDIREPLARRALGQISGALFRQTWKCQITKDGEGRVLTSFTVGPPVPVDGDGEGIDVINPN